MITLNKFLTKQIIHDFKTTQQTMLKISLKGIPLLLLTVGIGQLQAQNIVLASGGNAMGTGGSVSYSIGQLDYISVSGSYGSVSQGVQQPVVSSTLPIFLLNLKANKLNDKVLINWQTTSEINSRSFAVERSNDGVIFTTLNNIAAAGNSTLLTNYLTEDKHPLPGSNFYRIKQVSGDGRFVYSMVVSVTFNPSEGIAVIYPNPAKDAITLQVPYDGSSHPIMYKLFNIKGQVLLANKISNNVTIIPLSNLSPSNYFLKIVDGNQEIKTFKIVKTN